MLENNKEDLEFFNLRIDKNLIQRLTTISGNDFNKVSYTEAIEIIKKNAKKVKFENPVEWGVDLASEHEKWLVDHLKGPTVV